MMTEAERLLLDQIRRGNAEAWGQLVERFQGRLLAFARSRGVKGTDADDLVQDTFLLFLRGLAAFRGQASLETFLFVILRRRVIEHFRGRQTSLCRLTESWDASDRPSVAAPDPSASWYVARDERRESAKSALAEALRQLTDRLRSEPDFAALQLIELLFFAHARNKEIAALLHVEEQHVALQKHRWLKQLAKRVADTGRGDPPDDPSLDSLLTEVWSEQRPTCPKRTTIGGFVLGTLETPWQKYIDFHVNQLGCAFCQANLHDLQKQQTTDASVLRRRIMQSTIGFLRA